MLASLVILALVTLAVALHAWRRDPQIIREARAFSLDQGVRLALRLPFAMFAAACLSELIPDQLIAGVMGPETGLTGIVLAAFLGGLLPGGPIVSFPLAIMFARDGAGGAQVIALVSGWSVYAINRVVSYEIPIMGPRFTLVRVLASLAVPILAAIGAGLVADGLGLSLAIR
jgi:uncharacterized membrane protein YraQ (UPF0718 family)